MTHVSTFRRMVIGWRRPVGRHTFAHPPAHPVMLSRLALSAALSVGGLSLVPRLADPAPLRGFTADGARTEREWESKFKAIPEPSRMREAMRLLSARPHHVGSAYGKQNAEWLRDQFRAYGWQIGRAHV